MNVGKKAIAILLISAFFFGVTSAAAAAKTLDVRKVVENGDDIKVGDAVAIHLRFKNPFKQAIPIQIVDQNVFGNNGLDIKCLEYTLPAKEESVIVYSEPIVPFKPGKYTLDVAKVTYTNPEMGKHETVESNTLDIEVNANNSQPPGQQAQGITTIYQCNGTNIHSTSYSSSGSSFNIQIGSSSRSYSYGNEQQQSGGQQQESVEKRVTNNQISQNTGQLKKKLEKEMQQQKEQEERMRKELAKNADFQKYDKRIKADYINGTIRNVTLESIPEQKEESGSPWWLLLLIPLAGVIATGWFIFDNKLDIKRELLNSELMNALKGRADADTCSKVNECLDLCGMVEFAKYKTNREDFGKIVEIAKGVIV